MYAIEVEHLSKSFRYAPVGRDVTLKETIVKRLFRGQPEQRKVQALRDVTFGLEQGRMLGVVGRNGSGKTTLLRLLSGVYRPDSGRITISGSLTPLLSLGAGFHPELSGRENIKVELLILGLSPRQIRERMDRIIEFSEIGNFADAPVRTYSTGMRMRLAFAAAVSVDPDVLLLDEVLAVGDEAFARKCYTVIDDFKARQKTIVLVTHSAEIVAQRCETALWLDAGQVAAYGQAADVVAAYRAGLNPAQAHELATV
jgi:ABC-type polysaccharide/polyol phosphate transport system ATPase subunit